MAKNKFNSIKFPMNIQDTKYKVDNVPASGAVA